jgi:hypothetical protein
VDLGHGHRSQGGHKPGDFTAAEPEKVLIERIMPTGFTREQAERIVREGADPRTVAKPH